MTIGNTYRRNATDRCQFLAAVSFVSSAFDMYLALLFRMMRV